MELKNVTRYYPENMPFGEYAAYYCSEDGQDFYDSYALFTQKYKLCITPDAGIICAIEEDVSALNPEGFTIVEVNNLPEGCDDSGRWKYDNGKVVDTMTPEKAIRLKTAEINAWRDEQEQGNVIFEVQGHNWDASLASLTRIESVMPLVSTGMLSAGFFWTDANNEDIPATAELLTAIYEGMQQALVVQGFKIHERQRQMKQEVAELATTAEIEAYKVGWCEDETTAA